MPDLREDLETALGDWYVPFTDTDGQRSFRPKTAGEHLDTLLPIIRQHLAAAWDDGAETALDHAIRNDDGITLRLEKPNPWREP